MANQIQIRRDIALNWFVINPVLEQGEIGYETDNNRMKIGDGIKHWNDLPYYAGANMDIDGGYPSTVYLDYAVVDGGGVNG